SRRLAKCCRPNPLQLIAYFPGNTRDGFEREIRRDRSAFCIFEAFDLPLLLGYIAAVFGFCFDCSEQSANRIGTQSLPDPRQYFGDGRLRPLQPLPEAVIGERGHQYRLLTLFHVKQIPPGVADQTDTAPDRCQAFIRVVDSEMESEFSPGGEHPVRLVGTLRDQIVDQNAYIALGPPDDHLRFAGQLASGIYSGHDSLAAGLLVARSAVDLTSQIKPSYRFDLQGVIQFARVYGIIFDRVAGTDHFRLLKPRNRSYHGFLHVDRHAGRHAVHVYFVRVQPFRFEKNQVPRLVRKLDDLILDRRAIARSGALDLTAIQRRAGNAFLQ